MTDFILLLKWTTRDLSTFVEFREICSGAHGYEYASGEARDLVRRLREESQESSVKPVSAVLIQGSVLL